MTKTTLKATIKKCYWDFDNRGFYLADHTRDVYSDIYGLWLKHPKGYTKIKESDIIGG